MEISYIKRVSGKMDEAVYFGNCYEDEWITDKRSVEFIKAVDKSDVISAYLIEGLILSYSLLGSDYLING